MITLNYQIIYDKYSKEKQCFISKVEPERIGLHWDNIKDSYNIVHHPSTKQVTLVENRGFGKVMFKAVEAD